MVRAILGILSLLATSLLFTDNASAQAAVDQARTAWEQTADRVTHLSDELALVVAQVDTLKQAEPPQPELLAETLRRSILIQAELEAADGDRRDATSRYQTLLTASVQKLDQTMLALVPALKVGPHSERRRTAQRMLRLRKDRIKKATILRSLTASTGNERWATFARTLPPAHTPEELEARADFLEDARDKLVSKQTAVLALLRTSQRRQTLEETTYTFLSETSLFDEQTRIGRVLRRQPSDSSIVSRPDSERDVPPAGGAGRLTPPPPEPEPPLAPEPPPESEDSGIATIESDPTPELDEPPVIGDEIASGPSEELPSLENEPPTTDSTSLGPEFGRPVTTPEITGQTLPVSRGLNRVRGAPIPTNLARLLQLDPDQLDGMSSAPDLKRLLEQLEAAKRTLTRSAQTLRQQADTMHILPKGHK